MNPHRSLGHVGALAPSDLSPLFLQTRMSARRAQSSVARTRCASTPVEVPTAWMRHARPGTGEAPAPGESLLRGWGCPPRTPHGTVDPGVPAVPEHSVASRIPRLLSCRVCVGRCTPDCGSAGPPTLRYQLLTLPLGIAAGRDVVHLAPGAALRHRPVFTLLDWEPGSPFVLRTEQGRGIISTLRPLRDPGTHRLKVQALVPGGQRAPSVFLLLISISPYPY